MNELQELVAQLKKVNAEISELTKKERGEELKRIRIAIATFGFTERELFGRANERDKTKADVAPKKRKYKMHRRDVPKYRNPETGETWSGLGRPPPWIADKPLKPFLIAPPSSPGYAGLEDLFIASNRAPLPEISDLDE